MSPVCLPLAAAQFTWLKSAMKKLLSTACFLSNQLPSPYVLCLLQKELKKQYFRDPVLYEVNDEPVSGLICWSAAHCATAHAASGCVCNITGSNKAGI